MKLNKIMKIVVAMMLVALVAVVASQAVMAINPANASLTNTFTQTDNSGASQAASNVIGMIINIAQVIGMGVAIIMLIVLAIQYIAEVKKNATIYIVGAVILFAASGLLGIIRRFAVQSIGTQSD